MTTKTAVNSLSKKLSYTSLRPEILREVPETAMRVLDVGCSNGELGAALRELAPGRYIAGIEFDPIFCQEAAAKLNRAVNADLNNFDWEFNFPDDRFDCIIFADVLEHLLYPGKALSAAIRLLDTNGIVIVSLPNIRHVSAFASIFWGGSFPMRSRGLFDETHLRWFTSTDANSLLLSAGLKVDKLSAILRLTDTPGTKANKLLQGKWHWLARWRLIREFLGYQFVLVGSRTGLQGA